MNDILLDADLPAGFDPDDLDDQMFDDYPAPREAGGDDE